jgi:diguanylate cyclase (GGDEF)-like protein
MSDKPPHVLLISADAALVSAIERQRPPHRRLATLPAGAAPAPAPPPEHCWVDLDSAPALPLPPSLHYVYFHTPGRDPPAGLPPGVFIPKPSPELVLSALWADTGPPSPPIDSGASLPVWALEFHLLALGELCRRCVCRLPQRLGHRYASLYLYDPDQRLLTLAASSQPHPVDLAVRIDVTPDHPLAVAARTSRPADPVVPTGDREFLLPLLDGVALAGVLHLSGGGEDAAAPAPSLLTFLARALLHARGYEQACTEARVDGLTGLLNYRGLVEALDHEIGRAERFGTPLAVLMVDLDHLKRINDSFGHAAGDLVLRHLAGKITPGLRRFDAAARTGGDEFVVLLPGTDAAGAMHVGERVLQALHRDAPVCGGHALSIGASLGVAQWQPGWTPQQLIAAADQAMYRAKRAGRNRLENGHTA